MKNGGIQKSHWLWASISATGLFISLYFLSGTSREHFQILVLWFLVSFSFYLVFTLGPGKHLPWIFGLSMAILCRLVFFCHLPQLSDDYFRFIWDGKLVLDGFNPYLFTPQQIAADANSLSANRELLQSMNSPGYYSVYPPPLQLLFAISEQAGRGVIENFVLVHRLILLAFEIGTILLLRQLLLRRGQQEAMAYLYALNPLVMVEIMGNLHHEGIVIFFLLLAILLFQGAKLKRSGLAMAGAVASKLTPLLVLPLFLRPGERKRNSAFLLFAGVLGLALFTPLLFSRGVMGFAESLSLYFVSFEFNASIYYLLRAISEFLFGFNPIHVTGPLLKAAGIIIMTWLAIRYWKKGSETGLPSVMLLLFFVYLVCSTVVHPWYILPIIALSPLTPWRFPVVWSLVAILSYSAYRHSGYGEELVLVAIEYLVVGAFFVWEWRREIKNGRG